LIHGDRHGIINVPLELVPHLPAVAQEIAGRKQHVMDLAGKAGTTPEEYSRGVKDLLDFSPDSLRDGAQPRKR
jgi:hypothetical protein